MSYWAEIKTTIRDLDALQDAAIECGCGFIRLVPGATEITDTNGRKWRECEALVTVLGMYCPILVKRQTDGTYALSRETDYEAGYAAKLGKNLGKLVQLYGVHWATKTAQKMGHKVHRTLGTNGRINVVVSGTWA